MAELICVAKKFICEGAHEGCRRRFKQKEIGHLIFVIEAVRDSMSYDFIACR